ncbi:alpha/beta hydrolase [uncultured Methanobrevibacter sp.]|uniref:alpha/beta hydrolase n=1 Tax=uncultured Methanobrevibacter sp. TaxID=253161 RepID=UPI0025CCB5BC|nr:alpha/beta hydrolase [uncultured Methanobrevibacter sp.]
MNKKFKILIVIGMVFVLGYTFFYMTSYHPAQKEATDLLNGTDNVSVIKKDYGLLLDGDGNDTLLIFYPGAKNEYISYLPLLVDITNKGIDCALVQMMFNFAFFGENTADSIIDSTNYSHYIMAGHSLGGLSAAAFTNHTGKADAVILLAAYPNSEVKKPVLSVYGSEDKILNMKAYNDSKSLMDNLTEVIIDGGNHEQFAYYGPQEGDGVANITPENQQNQTADAIFKFISQLF